MNRKLATLCLQARSGVPVREWCDGSGLSISTWSRVENEGSPSFENFVKIAHWLGLKPSTLMAQIEDPRRWTQGRG